MTGIAVTRPGIIETAARTGTGLVQEAPAYAKLKRMAATAQGVAGSAASERAASEPEPIALVAAFAFILKVRPDATELDSRMAGAHPVSHSKGPTEGIVSPSVSVVVVAVVASG